MAKNFDQLSNGRQHEVFLELIMSAYAAQRRAKIVKVDPPVSVTGGHGFRRVVLKENPHLDYAGTWTENGGRALHIEAKSTTEPRLPVCIAGGVTPEQMNNLREWQEAGAAVCVLWAHKGDIRLATYDLLELQRLEGRGSLAWRDAWPIPPGTGLVSHDFLTAMKALDSAV